MRLGGRSRLGSQANSRRDRQRSPGRLPSFAPAFSREALYGRSLARIALAIVVSRRALSRRQLRHDVRVDALKRQTVSMSETTPTGRNLAKTVLQVPARIRKGRPVTPSKLRRVQVFCTTAAVPGTSSSNSLGKSCPSEPGIGPIGADQGELTSQFNIAHSPLLAFPA